MFASSAVHEFIMNIPTPCIYFDGDNSCKLMNQLSKDFFEKWGLECNCIHDIAETFDISPRKSGRAMARCGCIDYAFVPVNNGNIFIFNQNQTVLDFQKSLPVGVMIVDRNGKIVSYNPKLRSLLGFSPADIKSMSALKARWTDNGIKLSTGDWAMTRSLKRGEAVEGDSVDITAKDGSRSTLYISSCPIRDTETGSIIGSVSLFQDISSQRIAEMDAVEGKRKAEDCLKLLVDKVKGMCSNQTGNLSDLISRIGVTIENEYKSYQIENRFFSSELMDISYLIDSAGCECERTLKNGTTVLCEVGGHRLVSANIHLKEAFKTIINKVAESAKPAEIMVKIRDYCEHGKEFHRVEICDRSSINSEYGRLAECSNNPDADLSLACRIFESFGGHIWVEERMNADHFGYSKFVVILPVAVCTDKIGIGLNMEGFA